MHERDKLQEAEFFYTKLVQQSFKVTFTTDPTAEGEAKREFRYLLSAFLSAARSVLQFAKREAEDKQDGIRWYVKLMADSPELLGYFRDKRDLNIHERPIAPGESMHAISPSHAWAIPVKDQEGVRYERLSDPVMTTLYYFDDRPDDEDIVTLARAYLDALHQAVEEGVQRGIISG